MKCEKFYLLTILPLFVVSNVIRNFDNNNNFLSDSNRRISPFNFAEWFISGLYNKNGKIHDLGSDFGLTHDLYNKPNPYYTKNERKKRKNIVDNDDDIPRPVYIHPTVTQQPPPTDNSNTHSSSSYHDYSSKSNAQTTSSNSVPNSYSYNPPSAPASSYSVQTVTSYSPTNPGYGAPVPSSYYPSSSYGVPSATYGVVSYPTSMPVMTTMPEAQKSHGEWFLAKLMKKIDLVLVSKIMLKLIIFKKIMKFIGIICLLLFLPILKKKFEEHAESDEDYEARRIGFLDDYAKVDIRLREIVNFALSAVDGFQHDNIPWCVGESQFYCRVQYMLDEIDVRYPGTRIVSTWFPELTTTVAPPTKSDFDDETLKLTSAEIENENEIPDDATPPIEKFNKIFKRNV